MQVLSRYSCMLRNPEQFVNVFSTLQRMQLSMVRSNYVLDHYDMMVGETVMNHVFDVFASAVERDETAFQKMKTVVKNRSQFDGMLKELKSMKWIHQLGAERSRCAEMEVVLINLFRKINHCAPRREFAIPVDNKANAHVKHEPNPKNVVRFGSLECLSHDMCGCDQHGSDTTGSMVSSQN